MNNPEDKGNAMMENTSRQQHVTSADGTMIAVTVTGQGRPLVVSPGSLSTAQDWQPVADALAPHFTTYAVDRRGHGASGDNPDFSIEREQQDIAAVVELAGPDALLLAHSYGGYSANVPVADLVGGKAMIATHYDGQPLTRDHGGPARLLVPHLYFWKSAKWINALQFTKRDEAGFWELRGYHIYGDPWREQRYRGDQS